MILIIIIGKDEIIKYYFQFIKIIKPITFLVHCGPLFRLNKISYTNNTKLELLFLNNIKKVFLSMNHRDIINA